MEVLAGGKDSHWWDWSLYSDGAKISPSKLLKVSGGTKKLRKYRRVQVFGQYNLSGLKDLLITLFVLRQVVVLKPKNYKGEWSLIIKGDFGFGSTEAKQYIISNFLSKGSVKSLLDGTKEYVGVSQEGKYLELVIQSIESRYTNRKTLFI
jgi:hypothetical protein